MYSDSELFPVLDVFPVLDLSPVLDFDIGDLFGLHLRSSNDRDRGLDLDRGFEFFLARFFLDSEKLELVLEVEGDLRYFLLGLRFLRLRYDEVLFVEVELLDLRRLFLLFLIRFFLDLDLLELEELELLDVEVAL